MSLCKILIFALVISVIPGCTLVPTGSNITIEGSVYDSEGKPVEGAEIYYVDMLYRVFSMPDAGEHGTVFTDSKGFYRISLIKVHDAVDIAVWTCSDSTLVEKHEWKSTNIVRRDFHDCT